MSARVVLPFSLTEMRRLREAVVAKPVAIWPDPAARARVARNLWGCASSAESRAFVSREMEAQRERAAERWGFDFAREAPRLQGPGSDRYAWRPVKIRAVPAVYRPAPAKPRDGGGVLGLETARPTVPARQAQAVAVAVAATPMMRSARTPLAAEASTSSSATVPLAMASPDMASPPSASTSTSITATAHPVATRQTTMKDYMRNRKRSLSDRKHESPSSSSSSSPNPAKRARPEATSL